MKRDIMLKLEEWSKSADRKPLILTGARQVGKTWALREFGRTHFQKVAYITFEDNPEMKQLFDDSLDPDTLLPFLRARTEVDIQPNDTLMIFDEIQEVPKAITSLKYFCEKRPEYAIAAAGSTLGITLHENTSFPVGKVDFLELYPMSFNEFLRALGRDELVNLIEQTGDLAKLDAFNKTLNGYLRQYFYIGGMPEAVQAYVTTGDFGKVRDIQQRIIGSYNNDFAKHATPSLSAKLRLLWQAIPAQLAKENRKFIYGAVRSGARARDFEVAIQWLKDSSLVHSVNCVNAIKLPLKFYEDMSAFKLFVHDLGLLGAMMGVVPQAIVDQANIYTEFKGALTEQFVCQELIAAGATPFYWSSDDSRQEIDFLLDGGTSVKPIEVKAGKSLASPSFNRLLAKRLDIPVGYKLSPLPYRQNDRVVNMPLYLCGKLAKRV